MGQKNKANDLLKRNSLEDLELHDLLAHRHKALCVAGAMGRLVQQGQTTQLPTQGHVALPQRDLCT